MDDEFNEEELDKLIEYALGKSESANPFVSSGLHLGLAESETLSKLHNSLSKRFVESEVNDIFQEVRGELNNSTFRLDLKSIHTVARNCNKCSISAQAELPKWNLQNPDIVVVIDSPSLPSEAIAVMLNAFKNAGLSSDQLCLTYVNRCPAQRKYEPQEVMNCTPYLHSELIAFNPKLILCLGGTPTTAVFGAPAKSLKDFRGQVTWLGSWPIMATYSPMYVLRAGESAQQAFVNDIITSRNFINS